LTVNWHCIILPEYVHWNVNHHILTVNWHCIILPEYVHWNVNYYILTVNCQIINPVHLTNLHVLTGAVSIRTGRVILMMTVEMGQMKPTVLPEYVHWNVNHHILTVNWHFIILPECVHWNVNHHFFTVNWHFIILQL
jgi:hypothetical protein